MINVKFLEANAGIHGVVEEMMLHPPDGVNYSHFGSPDISKEIITLPMVRDDSCDLVESFDTAVVTKKGWVYTGSNFTQLASFELFGSYLSRDSRLHILEKMLEKDNCKKLMFPSNAGYKTVTSYGRIHNRAVLDKCAVVPYAFREVDDKLVKFRDDKKVSLLFIGSQFVRKGGKQLVDAFSILSRKYDIELNIVSNFAAWQRFTSREDTAAVKDRLSKMKNVNLLSTKRDAVLSRYYPDSDIFVFPTMWETFGFVPIEAMAYGLPVVSTDWPLALPEIVEDNKSGFLIKIMKSSFMKAVFDNRSLFNSAGYYVPPKKFHDYFVKELVDKLSLLIEDFSLRKRMGLAGLKIARSKFSFESRNKAMKEIYGGALG